MKIQKLIPAGYNSTYKTGEYEFLIKVRFIPLILISELARVRVELVRTKAGTGSWNKSGFVRRSESYEIAQIFISSYLKEAGHYKIAYTR